MGNASSENIPRTLPKPRGIPESIRNHPKLNQATKFLWVYVWELADFRPNTIITTPARLAASVGASERSVIRQLGSLLDAGLIEQVGKPKRGEWVYYIQSPKDWEIRFMVEMEHVGIGKSVLNPPIQNEENGTDAPSLPILPEATKDPDKIADAASDESKALARLIDRKSSQMTRKPFSEYDFGTPVANCEQSRSNITPRTVDSRQLETPAPADSESQESAQNLRRSSPPAGPMLRTMVQAVEQLGRQVGGRENYNQIYDWLRDEWPNEDEVYGQLLHRISAAVVMGKLDKGVLSKLVHDSKQPRIKLPEIYFCSTITKLLPKTKP